MKRMPYLFCVAVAFLAVVLFAAIYNSDNDWHCGNHDPGHTARTTEEVANSTVEFGCKSWHLGNKQK